MFSLEHVTRAATGRAIAPRIYNFLYGQGPAWFTYRVNTPHNLIRSRQILCTFAAQLRFACGSSTPEDAVDDSNKLPARNTRGRPPLPSWSEAEQQAVRRFWEGLSLSSQQVASLVTQGKTKSLFRHPKELERRIHEMQKLIPGVKTTAVAQHALIKGHPETLANNVKRLRSLLSISDQDLRIVLSRAPHMLTRTPEVVAERFAAWRTFFAVDHAQMVMSLKQCPELVCHNDASVRNRLQTFLDTFESCRLGNRPLAMQIFLYNPGVVVRMSSKRITTRCKRLGTEFTELDRSTWPVLTWRLALECADNVLDRLLFRRQHAVPMAASTALTYPATSWHKRFPEFMRWQQELTEAQSGAHAWPLCSLLLAPVVAGHERALYSADVVFTVAVCPAMPRTLSTLLLPALSNMLLIPCTSALTAEDCYKSKGPSVTAVLPT
eukprot:jgi/Chlat1/4528/Chrsp29S08893